MEILITLTAIAAAHFVAVASPGPSLVVVAQTAISDSRSAATWNAVGFGVGTLVWAVSALFGLAVLFELAPWLYLIVKSAGACFLIYLAYRLWQGASRPFTTDQSSAAAKVGGRWNSFLLGLVTQLSNPKVAIFFGSIFVTMVPQDADLHLLITIVLMVFLIETVWYSAMAHAFSTPRIRDQYVAHKSKIDRTSASFLAFLGVGLLVDRR